MSFYRWTGFGSTITALYQLIFIGVAEKGQMLGVAITAFSR